MNCVLSECLYRGASHSPLLISDCYIFRQQIHNSIHTSKMQTVDKYHCLVDIGELGSTLYIVLNVGVGDGTNLSHLSVNEE